MSRPLRAAIVVLLCTSLGCASSTYTRATAADDQLVWAADDGELTVMQGDAAVARAPSWDGLSDVVGCVPAAQARADGAEVDGALGVALRWTGATMLIAAPVVLVTAGVTGALLQDITPFGGLVSVGGLGGSVVLLAGAGVAWLTGGAFVARALPQAVDAVNIYLDERETCRR